MKSAIYYGKGDVRIEDIAKPLCGDEDVVVKVKVGSICGTDVTEYNVENYGAILPGREFGHELSGIVDKVGKDVRDIVPGMRVTVNPLLANSRGRRESCMLGSFSQFVLVEKARLHHNLFPLPDSVSYENGSLVEPFSVGMHGVNMAEVKPGDHVLILGAGPIGLGALAGTKALGVNDVFLSDISDFRLDKALEMGASAVHNPLKRDMKAFFEELYTEDTVRFGCVDAIIDAAGVGSALQDALKVTSSGARISIIALHKKPVEINPMMIMSKTLTIRGSMGYDNEFDQVLSFLEKGKADLSKSITHEYPLEEINDALRKAAETNNAAKVIVRLPE